MPNSSKIRVKPPEEPVIAPFIVAIDTREQAPYAFCDFDTDSNKKYRPLIIRTQTRTLKTGDYSVVGLEDRVTVERKSLEDAFGTFGAGRERFERELERMAEFEFASVVIEASWANILGSPPQRSKLLPKTVYRSVLAWQQRYGVHFWDCPGRHFAERTTYRILERFWKDNREGKRNGTGSQRPVA